MDLGQGPNGVFRIERFSEGGEFYHMMLPSTSGPAVTAVGSSGALRLVRSGSTLLAYYRSGGAFVQVGTASTGTGPTRFALNGGLFRTNALAAAFAFDNFKVNVGTSICPR